MKQTILVTGGTGFIGSHTTVELQEAGYEVVIIDNLSNSNENVIDGIEKITGIRPAFEKVDCCDYDALEGIFKKYPKIEGIIHFAASKAVGESVERVLMVTPNRLTRRSFRTISTQGRPSRVSSCVTSIRLVHIPQH